MPWKSNECLSSTTYELNDTQKIMINLDPNKYHGHDMLSMCMLQQVGESIYKTWNLLFSSCLETDQFLSEWAKR